MITHDTTSERKRKRNEKEINTLVWIQMEKWDLSLKDFEALRKEMPGNTDVARALSEVQVAMKNSKGRGLGTEEKQQQQRLGVEVNVCSNDQLREEISNHGRH
jgi:hypothetical protein